MSTRRASASKLNSKQQLVHLSKQLRQQVADVPVADSTLIPIPLSENDKKAQTLLRVLFFLFFFCFWTFWYRDFLFMAQQYDLFLWNINSLRDSLTRVAGLSRYISSFVIQFFYYPIVGALILSGFSLFIQFATEKIFKLHGWKLLFSFIPSCLLTLIITSINYFIFERIDVAYAFSFIFNFSFALLLTLIYQNIKNRRLRFGYLVAALIIFYPVFGFFSLFSGFLCVFIEWNQTFCNNFEQSTTQDSIVPDKKKNAKTSHQIQRERCEVAALFILVVPCLYWFVFSQTTPNFYRLYSAGLWEESTLTQGRSQFATNVFAPFLTLLQGKSLKLETDTNAIISLYISLTVVYFIVLTLLSCIVSNHIKTFPLKTSTHPQNGRFRISSIKASFIAVAIMCGCVVQLSFSSPNYRALLQIARALDREAWEEIIKIESNVPTPINPLVSARILSLSRTNRLANEAFLRPIVPKDSPALRSVTTFCMCGDRMLYEYGLTNLAIRTATNNFITKRDRSVWALKTLALAAVVDERPALAQRYLYRLKDTLYYRDFAIETLDYLSWKKYGSLYDSYLSSGNRTSSERLSELDRQFNSIRKLKPLKDDLSSSGTVDTVRYRVAQTSDLSPTDIDSNENLIGTLLISRNFPRFTEVLDGYLELKGNAPLPKHIQEAMLFRQWKPELFNPEQKEWRIPEDAHIDPQIYQRFQAFISSLRPNKSDAELNAILQAKFGDTFWFFFGSATVIPNY